MQNGRDSLRKGQSGQKDGWRMNKNREKSKDGERERRLLRRIKLI